MARDSEDVHGIKQEESDGRSAGVFKYSLPHLMQQLPAGVHICDADGHITYHNETAERIWGRAPRHNDPADRYCGSYRMYLPDSTPIPHDECWIAQALREDVKVEPKEVIVEQPGGERIYVLAYANPIRDDAGAIIGAINIIVDITSQKRLEEAHRIGEEEFRALNATLEQRVEERTRELHEANRKLAARNKELQDFAHVASHDLQEPLRKFRTFLGLLRSELQQPTDAILDYIVRMDASAERMTDLIRALLALSRIGTRGERFQPVDLSALLRDVTLDLEDRISESAAKVDVTVTGIIEADPAQIRQLFQNLLCNALKFRHADITPEVIIRSHPVVSAHDTPAIRIEVSDNGIGFDEKYIDRIFTPFQRLQSRSQFEGTGMGLAICRRIVERHGGTITATSIPGDGSTFAVILPVSHGKSGSSGATSEAPESVISPQPGLASTGSV